MGNFSPLTDSLRGQHDTTALQVVLQHFVRHPAFLPGAIITSQSIFFGTQAVALWRQLQFMKTPAYHLPIGLDMKPEDAKVHVHRIRQKLVRTLLDRAAFFGVSVFQVLGGWNASWKLALAAGNWYERTFESSRGYLISNPAFFLLDFAIDIAASTVISNSYLAYNSAEIYPETANLSFLGRLKVHLSRQWKTSSLKMAFFKTFGAYLLPVMSFTPGIMLAAHAQHRFETGIVTSTSRACWELFRAGLLTLTLTGILGASIPLLFMNESDITKQGSPPRPTDATIESCPLRDLRDRDIQLKGQDKTVVDESAVERLVAEVVEDTRYKDTVKIVIRLDGGPEYQERGLRVFPYLSKGDLFLSQSQFGFFESDELKALIATAFLPQLRKPFDLKNSFLIFITALLPLQVDPLMYAVFRKVPWIFDSIIPSWRADASFIPMAISFTVAHALFPWINSLASIGASYVKNQVYRDDQRIAGISSEYVRGWVGVLFKHTGVYPLRSGHEEHVSDYGRMDPFFESWFATGASTLPTPGLLQRLEKLPGNDYSVCSTS